LAWGGKGNKPGSRGKKEKSPPGKLGGMSKKKKKKTKTHKWCSVYGKRNGRGGGNTVTHITHH